MPDDNVFSCNSGMKWSRKCEDKRKNCFELRAFVYDSHIGSRLIWFSSFTALHLSRYGETISGSLGHNNLTRQHSIDTISIHDYQRDSGGRNCPTLVMWIYLFHIFFEGRYEAINSEFGFLSFTVTLPYFSLSLGTSPEQIKRMNARWKKHCSSLQKWPILKCRWGCCITDKFSILHIQGCLPWGGGG